MANIIFIELADQLTFEQTGGAEKIVLEGQLMEPPKYDVNTKFGTVGDIIPGSVSGIFSLLQTFESIGGATANPNTTTSFMNVPIWQGTDPLKVECKITFFTETSAYDDVWYPSMQLQGLTMITQNPNGAGYLLPGINTQNLQRGLSTNNTSSSDESSANEADPPKSVEKAAFTSDATAAKLISVYIPGILYLPAAFAEEVKLTFSNEITESGYPLWAEININFNSITPANSNLLRPFIKSGESPPANSEGGDQPAQTETTTTGELKKREEKFREAVRKANRFFSTDSSPF
jgi:hypothetical protein